jgi:sporulation protein YlmC with PRC-barrel domain
VSAPEEPQVAWKAVEEGAVVLASDGEEIGTVSEIAGDAEADIFSGLVVSTSRLGEDRFLPAERVTGIWPRRVETSVSTAESEQLEKYRAAIEEHWEPSDDFLTRLLRRLGLRGRPPRD